MNVVFLNSHPIQYFVPLYQELTLTKDIEIEVLYCTDETIEGSKDREFGVDIKWDIPLLAGYKHNFIKNNAFNPSLNNGFWGLLNWGIIPFLFKKKKSIIIIHGWAYATNILTILSAFLFGHIVCIRAETPLNQELKKNKFYIFLRKIIFFILFKMVNYTLFIGKQNALFYKYYGVPDYKMKFMPYAVDNDRFVRAKHSFKDKNLTRKQIGIPKTDTIFLYSGKFIDKKRPLTLLKAFASSLKYNQNTHLVMVGDGILRNKIESFIRENALGNKVTLTGFINQSDIPLYYHAADVFVMCSGLGETWGLSVNEAMNFSLPLIVSETTGCSYDLLQDGCNGFLLLNDDASELSELILKFLTQSKSSTSSMGDNSFNIVNKYSYSAITICLNELIADQCPQVL